MAVRKVAISVVITTRNRADRLAATLEDLAGLRTDGFEWELLIVDNGSSDATVDVIAEASKRLPIQMLTLERAGKCRAQNLALDHAAGTLIVFTDDDVSVDPGWLGALWGATQRWPEADLFGGAIQVRLIGEVPRWLQGKEGQEIVARHCAYYAPRVDEGYTDTPPIGPNMAVRRRALIDIRFDENVGPDGSSGYIKGGDTDLNRDLMQRGHRCVFVPDAIVYHHAYATELTFEALFEGAFRRGRKNAYLKLRQKKVNLGKLLAERQSVLRRWLKYRLSYKSGDLAVYDAGMRYHYKKGYLYQAIRQRRSD